MKDLRAEIKKMAIMLREYELHNCQSVLADYSNTGCGGMCGGTCVASCHGTCAASCGTQCSGTCGGIVSSALNFKQITQE